MTKLLKIGIVGCGAIGTSLAHAVVEQFSSDAQLSALCDQDTQKAYQLANKFNNPKLAVLTVDEAILHSDLIVEATKAGFAFEIVKKALLASKDAIVLSVGGILEHYKELVMLAKENGARLYVPSGALCGIDGLKAASCAEIKKVILTTRKPPSAFAGIPYILEQKIKLEQIKEELVLFEGSASFAVKLFPQNINVAATLSLAGIGPENTLVRIVADPLINQNIHQVEIVASCGKITTRTENTIHPDNPKTSYLAVLSAVAMLKQILNPVKIGT